MRTLIALVFLFALLPLPAHAGERPICPTRYNLGYDFELNHAQLVAPGLARVVVNVRDWQDLALVVAQVVGRDGQLYGEPVTVTDWRAGAPLEILIAAPPEPTPPRYDVVPGVLVRTWRSGDLVSNYVCRQAILLPGARLYVPLVAHEQSP